MYRENWRFILKENGVFITVILWKSEISRKGGGKTGFQEGKLYKEEKKKMKKGLKRSLSFLLTAAMGLGLTSPVMAADEFAAAGDDAGNVKANEMRLYLAD